MIASLFGLGGQLPVTANYKIFHLPCTVAKIITEIIRSAIFSLQVFYFF